MEEKGQTPRPPPRGRERLLNWRPWKDGVLGKGIYLGGYSKKQ